MSDTHQTRPGGAPAIDAAVLERPGPATSAPLELRQRSLPEPTPGQVIVQVEACGVCRTDLQIVEGDLPLHLRPVVPGHQVVGQVVARGKDTRHPVGQRVGVTWLAGVCGHCQFCLSGHENLCEAAVFHGWDRDGGYATRMLVSDDFAFELPSSRPAAELAPLLCAGVIGLRALRATGAGAGDHVGLYGFGSSAALVLQLAVAFRIVVHVATRDQAGQQRALAMGAASVGGYVDPPPAPLHAAISFAPVGSVVVDALRAVRRGGTVVVNAIHLDEIPAFDYDLLWHERSLRSVANVTRTDVIDLLELADSIPLGTDPQVYPLSEANQALADLATGAITTSAVLAP